MARTLLTGNILRSGSIPTTALGGGVVTSSLQIVASLPTGSLSSSAQVQLSQVTGTTFSANEFTFPQGVTASAGFFGTASYATVADFALTPAGTSGTAGSSGTSGTAGSSGSSGTSGATGASGSSGSSGTSGTGFTTISNAADNRVLTSTGAVNTANAEANLTFDGSTLTVSGNLAVDTNTLFVDATNNRVGIGTASPGAPLHVAFGSAVNDAEFRLQQTTNGTAAQMSMFANNDAGAIYNFIRSHTTGGTEHWRISGGASTGTLTFSTNGNVERMRIDAIGNVGIGVTPSAWGNIFRVKQIGNGGSFITGRTDSLSQTIIGSNAFYDGTNWKYVIGASSAAARYYQNGGEHIWDRAGVGTAGNNITFNQLMILDASGNLGIGTTSPIAKLHVQGSSVYLSTTDDYASGTTGSGLIVARGAATGNTYSEIYGVQAGGTSYANLVVPGGNVGIGTTNPGSRLHILNTTGGTTSPYLLIEGSTANNSNYPVIELKGGTLVDNYPRLILTNGGLATVWSSGYHTSTYPQRASISMDATNYGIALNTSTSGAPTERVRIVPGGAVGINFTTPAGYGQLTVGWNATNPGGNTNNTVGVSIVPTADTTDAYYMIFFNATGGGIGSIRRVGTTAAVAFNTTSDRRLKENILPADVTGTIIDNIQIVKHDWKTGGNIRYGVVAQDLIEVFPEAVSVGDAENIANPRNPWAVDYSKLVPMLIKEIQMLRARTTTLEAEVAALKNQ